MRGVILAERNVENQPELVCALIRIGGISLLERQVRQLRKAGVNEIFVISEQTSTVLSQETRRLEQVCKSVRIHLISRREITDVAIEGELFLVTEGGSLLDERLLVKLRDEKVEIISVLPLDSLDELEKARVSLFKTGTRLLAFAGAAVLTAYHICAIPTGGSGIDSETLVGKMVESDGIHKCDLTALPTYSYDMRRKQPYLFRTIISPDDNPAAKRVLLDAAQKSVLDWPAWYIHRPIEKWIIYHLCECSITPNQLTLLNNIVAFLGMYMFARGNLLWAMAAALAVGVLDGLDGKQARVKVMTSEIGRIEEVLDKIYENGWFAAMAYWLYGQGFGVLPWLGFGVLLFCNMSDILIGLAFKARYGIQLDDFGEFERRFRMVSGRRNTYIWTLVPFVVAMLVTDETEWFLRGYLLIVAYSLMTVSVRFQRLVHHLSMLPINPKTSEVGSKDE